MKNRKAVKQVPSIQPRTPTKSSSAAAFTPIDLNVQFADELASLPIASVALFSLALTVYVLTMHPSVSGGDNGELLGCACELGVAHPPGYPTFTVIGHLFAKFLPFGSPAFRVAVMCAACNAGAAVFIMASVQRWILLMRSLCRSYADSRSWCGSLWAGFLAGSMFALSPLVWLYSLQAEVFAMNDLFAAMLVYFALRFNESHSEKTAYLGAFLIGLGLTNQHTLILFALPIVVWSVVVARDVLLKPKQLLVLVMCGLVGLTPYLLLVWMATYAPLGSWGDTSNYEGFTKHFLRKEYGTFQLYSGSDAQNEQMVVATLRYFKQLTNDSLWGGMAFLLSGIVAALHHLVSHSSISPTLAILGAWFTYLVVFHSLSNLPIDKKKIFLGIHMRFWLQPHVISFVLIGVGVPSLLRTLLVWKRRVAAPLVLLALAAQIGINYRALDQSGNYHIMELGKKHLEFLPPNAIMISQGDLVTNSMRYMQRCEKFRTDVLLLDETMMTYKWMRERQGSHMRPWKIQFPNELHSPLPYPNSYTMEEFLALNGHHKEHPVFKAGAWLGDMASLPDSGVPSWYTVPVGLAQAVLLKGTYMTTDEWLKWYRKGELFPSVPDHVKFDEYSWEWLMRRIVLEYRAKVGFHWANLAVETRERAQVADALHGLEDVLRLEELVHGNEPKSYILADLHNALGMLLVHWQHFLEEPADVIESNRRISYHFGKFSQLTPSPDKENGQEKVLSSFLASQPEYAGLVIPKEDYERQRAQEAAEKIQKEGRDRELLQKQQAARGSAGSDSQAKEGSGRQMNNDADPKKKKKKKGNKKGDVKNAGK